MGPDRWQPRGWPERWIVPGCGCACLLSQQRALAECEQERDAGKKLAGQMAGELPAGGKGAVSHGSHMDKSGPEQG